MLLFWSGPIRHGKALEKSAGYSVESDITNTFEKSLGVEVLVVDVVHDVGLLVELVVVNILDTEAYIIIK